METGTIIFGPDYDKGHHSFKYELFGKIDGKGWKLVVALDCASDFSESPRVSLVTIHRNSVKRAMSNKERKRK